MGYDLASLPGLWIPTKGTDTLDSAPNVSPREIPDRLRTACAPEVWDETQLVPTGGMVCEAKDQRCFSSKDIVDTALGRAARRHHAFFGGPEGE